MCDARTVPVEAATTDFVSEREITRSGVATRRIVTVLLLLACIAGLTGVLGGRTGHTAVTRHGYELKLDYPSTSRPGLDTVWRVSVVHHGGFKHPITLAVTGSYFDLFETQGWNPTPATVTRDGKVMLMSFTPPKSGDTFVVTYDSYLQPYIPITHLFAQHATVSLQHGDHSVAAIPFTTWVVP
jgi:hypothetical protein